MRILSTARRGCTGPPLGPFERLQEYREYKQAKEDDDLGVHIATMLKLWKNVRNLPNGVTHYEAARKLVDTMPPYWKRQARRLLEEHLEVDNKRGTVIDYVEFSAECFRKWIKFDDDPFLSDVESEEEDPEEDVNFKTLESVKSFGGILVGQGAMTYADVVERAQAVATRLNMDVGNKKIVEVQGKRKLEETLTFGKCIAIILVDE
ncbi:hypothetical protein DH2020_020222 [Rehmannia glutinosa]|uniref:Uncharacterized protein n=1 Tax=Rehmannia glutinosa TaxID=99300 RepID=A0ABR0WFP7_REHGL